MNEYGGQLAVGLVVALVAWLLPMMRASRREAADVRVWRAVVERDIKALQDGRERDNRRINDVSRAADGNTGKLGDLSERVARVEAKQNGG